MGGRRTAAPIARLVPKRFHVCVDASIASDSMAYALCAPATFGGVVLCAAGRVVRGSRRIRSGARSSAPAT